MAFVGLKCNCKQTFKKFIVKIHIMRGIILLLLALLVFGCTQPDPQLNETNLTNISNQTEVNQTNVTDCVGPVCGSDGNTYETDCDAELLNLTFVDGECPLPDCIESDDGIESKVQGNVLFGSDSFDDYCLNSTYLLEYACIDNEPENATILCDDGCEDGKCLEPEVEKPDYNCYGPIEADLFSTDETTVNGTTYEDYCIDFTTVKDYYCKENAVRSANNQCPSGYRCNAGACEELVDVCTETDIGADLFVRGRTIVAHGLATPFDKWDECEDDGLLIEHSCVLDGGAITEELECGSGYQCVGGKCIESSCSDTDDGYDIYHDGSTTLYDREENDDCINDYKLREYFCYGNDIDYDDVQCPEDHICKGDRCMEGSIS